jgi:hypothetical protein
MNMSKENLPLIIRPANENDVPFIFNSWLRSFRNGTLCRGVDNTIYFTEHHKLIERLLKTAKVQVAADANDIANILGWLCYEEIDGIFTVHYIYTKHTFRCLGVMRQLMKDTGHDFTTAGIHTHMTEIFNRLALKYNLLYHPYVLINRK